MEATLRVSVIVVNYNNLDDLEACLRSLSDNHHPEDEIILVDNASSDGSLEYVQGTFPHIRFVRNSQNLGFAGGSNSGAAQARGKYLAFLNPDTVVTPGWLDRLVEALDSDPGAGLATPKILLLDDPQTINAAGNTIHLSGITQCRGLGQPGETLAQSKQVPAVSGAAFVIRRELFTLLQGFDESFFMYMEDTDLSWRARLAGCTCLYVPDSSIYHDYTLRIGAKKIYYQERNRYVMLLKSLRWPTLLLLAPTLLLAEATTWGFVLLRDRQRLNNKLDAYRWLIKQRREIREARRRTQSIRSSTDRQLLLQTHFKLSFDQVDKGGVGALARLVFDPLFFLLRGLILALVWW